MAESEKDLGEWPPIKMGEIGIKLSPTDLDRVEVLSKKSLYVLEPNVNKGGRQYVVTFFDGEKMRSESGWLRKVGT